MRLLPVLFAAALIGCSQETPEPAAQVTQPDFIAKNALPVVLTYPDGPALEAIQAGTLRRVGPCLFLDSGAGKTLILWGDDIRAGRLGEEDWLINNKTTNQRFREGDFLQGAGGGLPEKLDIEAVTPEEVPLECENHQAIIFYVVRKAAKPGRGDGPPPPPPAPPPPPPEIIDQVKDGAPPSGAPEVTISGIADPREALFSHLIASYRASDHFGARSICLTDADDAMVAKLNKRFGRIENDRACGWKEGGVIRKHDGQPALLIQAKVDCSADSCAAEGGATYGNLGGEGYGYVLRRKGSGWTLQKSGIMWIS